MDDALLQKFEAKGLRVVPGQAVSTGAFNALTVEGPAPASLKREYGLVYGKLRFVLGSVATLRSDAQMTIQHMLQSVLGGSGSSTYALTLTIQSNGADVLKAVLATGSSDRSSILGIEVSSRHDMASVSGGILIKGVLLTESNNTLTAKLELIRSTKLIYDLQAAQKAADTYKAFSVAKLVPVATSFAPGLSAALELASLFFPAQSAGSESASVQLQFLPNDDLQTSHVFTKGGAHVATVSLELYDTIFPSSWDGAQHKFVSPDPELIWKQAQHTPTGKHAMALLRDDLPTSNQYAKIIRKFLTDLEANALTPLDKMDPQQQDNVVIIGEQVHGALKEYFSLHDASAIYWSFLHNYSTIMQRNGGGYMAKCLDTKMKRKLSNYGLDVEMLQAPVS